MWEEYKWVLRPKMQHSLKTPGFSEPHIVAGSTKCSCHPCKDRGGCDTILGSVWWHRHLRLIGKQWLRAWRDTKIQSPKMCQEAWEKEIQGHLRKPLFEPTLKLKLKKTMWKPHASSVKDKETWNGSVAEDSCCWRKKSETRKLPLEEAKGKTIKRYRPYEHHSSPSK